MPTGNGRSHFSRIQRPYKKNGRPVASSVPLGERPEKVEQILSLINENWPSFSLTVSTEFSEHCKLREMSEIEGVGAIIKEFTEVYCSIQTGFYNEACPSKREADSMLEVIIGNMRSTFGDASTKEILRKLSYECDNAIEEVLHVSRPVYRS